MGSHIDKKTSFFVAQFSGLKTDDIVLKMIFSESRHTDIDHKKIWTKNIILSWRNIFSEEMFFEDFFENGKIENFH